MPHLETVEVEGIGVPDPEIFHIGRRWPIAQALDHLLHCSLITFDMRFNVTVGTVANPSGHPKPLGLFAGPGAVEDPLYAPRDGKVTRDDCHYTVAMSGASSAFMPTTL